MGDAEEDEVESSPPVVAPKRKRSGPYYFIALLVGVVALIVIAAIAITSARSAALDRASAAVKSPPRYPQLKHSKRLICVYDVEASKTTDFREVQIPYAYCSDVVVCCATKKNVGDDSSTWLNARVIQGSAEHVRVFMGFAAMASKAPWLLAEMTDPGKTAQLQASLVDMVKSQNVMGGIYLFIPNYRQLHSREMVDFFFPQLSAALAAVKRTLIVSLPQELRLQTKELGQALMKRPNLFAKTTHFLPPFQQPEHQTVCSSPLKNPSRNKSVEEEVLSVKKWADGLSLEAFARILFTFDLACYKYRDQPSFPYRLHDRAPVPYQDFCGICSMHNSDTTWLTKLDPITTCRVASTKDNVFVSSNPSIVAYISAMLSNNYAGLVVFNIHLDDVYGLCGRSFGFIRDVYCTLESLTKEDCAKLAVY